MLKTAPAVFAVENRYQILVNVNKPCLFWIKVGEKEYFDQSNGIMKSGLLLHRAEVPMKELDKAGKYTVYARPIIERKPYFTETEPVKEYEYPFYPVPKGNIRTYHIADAHNRIDEPVAAANTFGDIDFLILNGDILEHCGDPSKFDNIFEICAKITKGSKPTVFSRGNHDLRGNFAENFAIYTPNSQGNTYYTFRLGSIWGILLDCGEDKLDNHAEYGHTVCCHGFRGSQTEFLKNVIANAKKEYKAKGVKTRLIISHVPFTKRMDAPFDIEEDIYRCWSGLLKKYVKPQLMLCGHEHITEIYESGGKNDTYGQPCTVVVGAKPEKDRFIGCGFVFGKNEIQIAFTDSNGKILSSHTIKS